MDYPTRRLMALDRLNAKIADAHSSGNEALCKELTLRRTKMNERVARTLLDAGDNWPDDEPEDSYDTKGRYIVPWFEVTGHPSKKGKPIAEEWMRQRNREWDGSVKSLRREVINALSRREEIPKFGLSIQLTCKIWKG
jgi:hypothetical protein